MPIVSLIILFVVPIVLLYLTVCTVLWTQEGKPWAKRLEGDWRGPQELQAHLFSAGWHRLSLGWFSSHGKLFSPGWCSSHTILSSRDWSNRHSHDIIVKPPVYGWSSHICAAHNLWPCEYLVTCTCRAINDLCYYILIVYKTWAQESLNTPSPANLLSACKR